MSSVCELPVSKCVRVSLALAGIDSAAGGSDVVELGLRHFGVRMHKLGMGSAPRALPQGAVPGGWTWGTRVAAPLSSGRSRLCLAGWGM